MTSIKYDDGIMSILDFAHNCLTVKSHAKFKISTSSGIANLSTPTAKK